MNPDSLWGGSLSIDEVGIPDVVDVLLQAHFHQAAALARVASMKKKTGTPARLYQVYIYRGHIVVSKHPKEVDLCSTLGFFRSSESRPIPARCSFEQNVMSPARVTSHCRRQLRDAPCGRE